MQTYYNATQLAEAWLAGKSGQLPNGCAKADATAGVFYSWDTPIAERDADGAVKIIATPLNQTSGVHQSALSVACFRADVRLYTAVEAIDNVYQCIPRYAFGTPVKLVSDLFGHAYDVPLMEIGGATWRGITFKCSKTAAHTILCQ